MKNEANIRYYGGDDDAVYVAPLGTPLPVGLEELPAAYVSPGFLDESGLEDTVTETVNETKVHQGGRTAKTKINREKLEKKFVCTEENAVVAGLMHPGSTASTSVEGVTTRKNIQKTKSDPHVWVFDNYDESVADLIHRREIWSRGEVTARGAVGRTASGATLHEFTVTCTGTADTVTNDPAAAVAA
ncbi:hypothetical protein [Glutamicibacter sp. NPDC087583]|uniref:hypothetical protein n=1 Tax=Glutamicibacter sp. NPDC087583 TaxID=3363995 RepID=UPI0038068F32